MDALVARRMVGWTAAEAANSSCREMWGTIGSMPVAKCQKRSGSMTHTYIYDSKREIENRNGKHTSKCVK
jgi:hypothetical protein